MRKPEERIQSLKLSNTIQPESNRTNAMKFKLVKHEMWKMQQLTRSSKSMFFAFLFHN